MREAFANYINGHWVEPKTDNRHQRENPGNTDEIVCSFPDSGAQDVADAVEAAAEAFESWRFVPAPRRAEVLFRAAEIMAARGGDTVEEMRERDFTFALDLLVTGIEAMTQAPR